MRPGQTGTHSIDDLQAVTDRSVVEFGVDAVGAALETDLENHNAIVQMMVTELCEPTTERRERYGTSASMRMERLSEEGRPRAQKVRVGDKVAYPLEEFGVATGFTDRYLREATPKDVAKHQLAVQKAHVQRIQDDISRAIYAATNYTFVDELKDQAELPVKRFVNADGAQIPSGPNLEDFDGATHSHYLAINWATATPEERNDAVLAAIRDLAEHGHTAGVRFNINVGNEKDFTDLPDFKPYPDPRVRVATTQDTPIKTLDLTRIDNRPIGIIGAAEVHTKSWVRLDYPFVYASGDPAKPLALREPVKESLRGLKLAYELVANPMSSKNYLAQHGVGVKNRTNGVVLFMGGGIWQNPILNV